MMMGISGVCKIKKRNLKKRRVGLDKVGDGGNNWRMQIQEEELKKRGVGLEKAWLGGIYKYNIKFNTPV